MDTHRVRSGTAAGLAVGAVALAMALPAPAQAAPTLDERLDAVTEDYHDAERLLDRLRSDRDDAVADRSAAQHTIDASPNTTVAVAAVDTADTTVGRLTVLAELGTDRAATVADAVADLDDANRRVADLDDRITDQETEVADLAEERSALVDQVARAETAQPETAPGTTEVAEVSAGASGAVEFARAQLGDPYVYGATGPDAYDCSGLTQAAWAAAGVGIGRDTYAQWAGLTHISADALQPGDLVFYSGQSHVAMYVGDGQVIHAPTPGDVVKYSPIDMMPIDGYARP